eukprot:GHVT01021055.1.p1 GENE.GHVT01021055.1~~GHVT01021055.1.p1  ORF type:complete len:302 (-),score=62.32 GHVT01021055.1:48-953(-)
MFAPRGIASLLKEGSRSFSGVEDATCRNIDACRKVSSMTTSCLGPRGLCKMLVNHFDKKTITNDAATIIQEMDIQHPAAKLLAMAAKTQDLEFGDGTNFVLIFAGELLAQAEYLLRQGLHQSEIIKGYQEALAKALELLPRLVCWSVADIRSPSELERGIRTSVASKSYSSTLAQQVAAAAAAAMPPNPKDFDVDNIRTSKMLGGSVNDTSVLQGMVIPRDTNGIVKSKTNCKVMVLACGIEGTGERHVAPSSLLILIRSFLIRLFSLRLFRSLLIQSPPSSSAAFGSSYPFSFTWDYLTT